MEKQLRGKKLLMLGTSMATLDIIRYARSEGVYVIFTDNIDPALSPGKKLADEYWNVSTDAIETLERLSLENKVNGVFAGVSEFNIRNAMTLCNRLHLPFYCTPEQWNALSEKHSFKALCRKFDIPVVEETVFDGEIDRGRLEKFHYPVVIKPVDGSGGDGVRVCHNYNEVVTAWPEAMKFSKSGKILLEPYVSGLELTIFYAIQNGKVFLTGMSDRYTRHKHGNIIAVPVAHVMPSVYQGKYLQEIDNKARAMFASLNLQNGIIFIQAFANNGNIMFYEMGYRLTGTQEYHILEHECGVNTMKMMVHYALTGKMGDRDISSRVNPDYSQYYCLINFLVKPGTIGEMTGTEEAAAYPEVINTVYEHRPGDTIPESAPGTLRQIAFRVFAKAPAMGELGRVMDKIHNTVNIVSDKGENMLLPPLNINELQHEA